MTFTARRKPSWLKRIGGTVVVWACICGLGLFADMSPRPLLLAGLCAGLSVAFWMMSDAFPMAQTTDWHISNELISRPRGADARVVAIQRLVTNGPESASARMRLQHIMSELAEERLTSLRGIDRGADPTGARAVLGGELDEYLRSADPDRRAPTDHQMSLLLNRIESI